MFCIIKKEKGYINRRHKNFVVKCGLEMFLQLPGIFSELANNFQSMFSLFSEFVKGL